MLFEDILELIIIITIEIVCWIPSTSPFYTISPIPFLSDNFVPSAELSWFCLSSSIQFIILCCCLNFFDLIHPIPILWCSIPSSPLPSCPILFYSILSCPVLSYHILCYPILFYFVLYYPILYCTVQYYLAPYCLAWGDVCNVSVNSY